MDAQEALADLKQISVQIAHAVVTDRTGTVLASTLADQASSERLARTAQELWEAADGARRELGRDELAQLEVATPDGSVFLVHDQARTVIATTSADPTVGLVFYDLKACLRGIAEGDHPAEAAPAEAPADVPASRETPASAAAEPSTEKPAAPRSHRRSRAAAATDPGAAAEGETPAAGASEEEQRGEA